MQGKSVVKSGIFQLEHAKNARNFGVHQARSGKSHLTPAKLKIVKNNFALLVPNGMFRNVNLLVYFN